MATTSFKTRKSLGRRYGVDPALLLEMERLNQQYQLAPGREARALSAKQFNDTMAFNQEQADLNRAEREEANEQAATSGMVGTVGNLATTGLTLRAMTKGANEPLLGETITKGVKSAFTPSTVEPYPPPSTTSTPTPAQIDTSGAGLAPAAGTGAGAETGGIAGAYAAEDAAAGAAFAETGATAGTTAGATAGSVVSGIASGVSTAVPYYGLAKLGGALVKGQAPEYTPLYHLGESLERPLNVEQYYAKEAFGDDSTVQTVLDVLNPLAPLERWVSDSLGTVICQELHRQGEVSEGELKWAVVFRRNHVSDIAYTGYRIWAKHVVNLMKTNRAFNRMFKPIALALVGQWVNIARGKKGSLFQRVVHATAYGLSIAVYYTKKIVCGVLEVAHG